METTDKDTGENAEVKFELDKNPGLKFSDLAFLSKQSQSVLKSRSPPCRNRCGSRWGGLLLPDGPQLPAGLRDRKEDGGDLRVPEQVQPDGAGQEPGQQRGQRHQQGPGDHPVQDGNRLLRWSRDQARRLPARSCGQSGGLCSEQDWAPLCVSHFTVTRSQARRRRV